MEPNQTTFYFCKGSFLTLGGIRQIWTLPSLVLRDSPLDFHHHPTLASLARKDYVPQVSNKGLELVKAVADVYLEHIKFNRTFVCARATKFFFVKKTGPITAIFYFYFRSFQTQY